MKIWAWVIGIMATIWSVVWLLGSLATERVIGAWLTQQEAAGWVVAYDNIATTGYPVRFNTEITGLDLADPFTGWAWQAPVFHIAQPSYQPHNVTATWPEAHQLATPFETLDLQSMKTEARLQVQPGANFAIDSAEATIQSLIVRSDFGWSSEVEAANAIITREEGDAARYEIDLRATGYTPAGDVLRMLDPAGVLPERIETFTINGVMGFARDWDLSALEQSRPAITRIELAELNATWGDLALRASGDLDVDANGIPTGEMTVRAQNWRDMVALGVNAGAIPEAFRGTLETGLSLIAGLSGRPEDIDTTLGFEDGQVYLGPIPLGPAPVFILR